MDIPTYKIVPIDRRDIGGEVTLWSFKCTSRVNERIIIVHTYADCNGVDLILYPDGQIADWETHSDGSTLHRELSQWIGENV